MLFLPFITGFFLAATALQLALYWGVFARLSWVKTPLACTPANVPQPVSVVVCARNDADHLRANLPLILSQQYDYQWELCVVNDASDDDTALVLADEQKKYPERLRVLDIRQKRYPGKKNALEQGIRFARYPNLLLTDADCRPVGVHWLSCMAAALLENPATEIVLGYGPMSKNDVPGSRWLRFETVFVAAQYLSLALSGAPYMGVGRNLAFKRQAFERVGGFAAHAHLVSGDDDLFVNAAANAQNTRICIHPASFMYSPPPAGIRNWLRQKKRHLGTGPAYKCRDQWMLALIALSHGGFYGFFLLLWGMGQVTPVILGGFLLREVSMCWILSRIFKRLDEQDLVFGIPILDALYPVYQLLVAPLLLLLKTETDWRALDDKRQ